MMDKILTWVETHFLKAIVLSILALLVILALILFNVAKAAEVNVSWTHPTQYTDNSVLDLANIKETQIQYGSCTTATTPTFGTMTAELAVPAPATTGKFLNVLAAKHCFRARTVDMQLRMSAWTTVIAKTVVDIKPRVPTGVVVQ